MTPRKRPVSTVHDGAYGRETLQDYLGEGEFVEAMSAVRWRVIRVFAEARSAPGKHATPGYVAGLEERRGALGAYVQRARTGTAMEKVFAADDLPARVRSLQPPQVLAGIVRRVHYELIVRQLLILREEHDIWYEGGDWCMPPTVLDEYHRTRKAAQRSYRDERSFHGRPNRDRDCPVYRQGTSVGAQR